MHCKYALSYYFHSYELHISLRYRKRKAQYHYYLGEDPKRPHILIDMRVSYNEISEFYFKTYKHSGIMVEQKNLRQ